MDKFPRIVAALSDMAQRFCTMLVCVDIGFMPDGTLDELPLPFQLGATRVGGIDLNRPRIRAVLAGVLALAPAPGGFTATHLTAQVTAMRGMDGYTTRQADPPFGDDGHVHRTGHRLRIDNILSIGIS
ncbi:hypothetical protein OG788_39870 [Streptomyces sp. NBC_00647]|uniref:hypothetical protein n=1 Tax=Streptomyces sp. NBC_00647 TaxID=2975796 RepID=UPI0032501677